VKKQWQKREFTEFQATQPHRAVESKKRKGKSTRPRPRPSLTKTKIKTKTKTEWIRTSEQVIRDQA
jgi:hypothetical protein